MNCPVCSKYITQQLLLAMPYILLRCTDRKNCGFKAFYDTEKNRFYKTNKKGKLVMIHLTKAFIVAPLLIAIILIGGIIWSSYVNKQVNIYAEELQKKKKQEEEFLWNLTRIGQSTYSTEMQPHG